MRRTLVTSGRRNNHSFVNVLFVFSAPDNIHHWSNTQMVQLMVFKQGKHTADNDHSRIVLHEVVSAEVIHGFIVCFGINNSNTGC